MESQNAQELIDEEIAAPRDLRTLRNSYTPSISKLPPELLGEIFVALSKSRYDYSYCYGATDEALGPRWLNVAGVCRNWREIALNTPHMWAALDLPKIKCLEWATVLVARSKDAPLRVRCTYQPLPVHVDRAVLSFVFARIDRIQDIDIGLDSSGRPKIEEFLGPQNIACVLQSLRISRRYNANTDTTENGGIYGFLNAVQMPRLRTLEVRSFPLPPTISMLPQLCRLYYLPPLSGAQGATMSGLLSFLRSTPSLKELEIGHPLGLSDQGTPEGCPIVTLPSLSFLSYTTMRVEDAALFRFIRYPPSARIRFLASIPPADEATLCTSDLVPILTHLSHGGPLANFGVVSFIARGARFGMVVDCRDHGPVVELNFCTTGGDMLSLLRLSAMLPPSSAHTFYICGFPSVEVAEWASLLGRHEHVQSLSAEMVDANFIRALLRPSETELPPFMQLKHLILRHCDIRESAASIERVLDEHRELGSPVDVLKINDCSVTVDIINHLQGYVRVVWDGFEG